MLKYSFLFCITANISEVYVWKFHDIISLYDISNLFHY